MANPTSVDEYTTHQKCKYLTVSTEATVPTLTVATALTSSTLLTANTALASPTLSTLGGTVAGAADFTTTGHHNSLVMLYNECHQGATGTWSVAKDDCTAFCAQNQTAATLVYPLTGLKIGDELVGFRILGAVGATGGNATTVDAVMKKVTKGAGTVTATSVSASTCSITQVSKTADYSMDDACTLGVVTAVAADYQYFVLVTVTTADNAACDVAVAGIEVDINRKV